MRRCCADTCTPGAEVEFLSFDSVDCSACDTGLKQIPVNVLNRLNRSGMPVHPLKLGFGAPVIRGGAAGEEGHAP